MSIAAGAAKRCGAKWSLDGVGSLADGELTRRLFQLFNGGVDGQVVRRSRCSELSRRFKPSRRSEPGASPSSLDGVVLWPDVVSQSPDGRRRARSVVVCARSVTRPLAGENCAVRADCCELSRLIRSLLITARLWHHVYALVTWEIMTRSTGPAIVQRVQSLCVLRRREDR